MGAPMVGFIGVCVVDWGARLRNNRTKLCLLILSPMKLERFVTQIVKSNYFVFDFLCLSSCLSILFVSNASLINFFIL